MREVVTDASVSARKRGIRVGMSRTTVQALVPEGVLVREEEQAQTPSNHAMERVWALLWRFSPWLETVHPDAFWLQVAGQAPPLREVRSLLQQVDQLLSTEQRLRVSFAETPFLARALVEWSLWETIPGAIYRKAGRQQLIVSPGLSATALHDSRQAAAVQESDAGVGSVRWLDDLPMQAMWLLPERTRAALVQLGVRRLRDLRETGVQRLCRHFGKEALQWLHWLQPIAQAGQTVRVNYPPAQWQETWQADIGEAVPRDALWALVEPLAARLAKRLAYAELGGLTVGLQWHTEHGEDGLERVGKRPLWRTETILAQLRSGLSRLDPDPVKRTNRLTSVTAPSGTAEGTTRSTVEDTTESADRSIGKHLESVTLSVGNLRPLSGTQLTFEVHDGVLQAARPAGENVEQLVRQVNRRYPNGLCIGMRPGFRELRLQAVLGT